MAARWSIGSIILLKIIEVFFFSPIYLSVIRLMRTRRIRSFSKVIESQNEYDIFIKKKTTKKKFIVQGDARQKEDTSQVSSSYMIKWTSSSDQSTVFMDFVKINVDRLEKKMNWEMKFPIRFVICKCSLIQT